MTEEIFDDQETEIGPQPGPQTILLSTDCEEVFFGGALGAGKSYALALDFEAQHQRYGGAVGGIVLRMSVPELDDLINTFAEVLEPLGWTYLTGKKIFKHPDGAWCRMRHADDEKSVKKYWGHAYCVGEGTPILMADGTHKAIEEIIIGDMVMTLEGPKPVTGVMPKKTTECIKAEIFDGNGIKIGEQIQPADHPLLSSVEELGVCRKELHRNLELSTSSIRHSWLSYKSLLDDYLDSCDFQALEIAPDLEQPNALEPSASLYHRSDIHEQALPPSSLEQLNRESLFDIHQASREIGASTTDVHNCDVKFGRNTQGIQQPLVLTCPVVLHEPSLRLALSKRLSRETRLSIESSGLLESREPFGEKKKDRLSKSSDRQQLGEQFQSLTGSDVWNPSDDRTCVAVGLQTASNYHQHYSLGCDRYGEPLLEASNSAEVGVPLRGGVASLDRADSHMGDKGNIPQCTYRSPEFSYIHPYTATRRDVVETIQIGSCKMTPVGSRDVYDLCVQDANHYISDAACISKNTWMGFDEYGDVPEKTFHLIQKLRAARLRSAKGVKVRFVSTGNPCGLAHRLCKERYISPAPPFTPFQDPRSKHNIIFIPGKMGDNIKMLMNDPEYRDRCRSMGPDWYVEALINGDWSTSPEGNMFHREWFGNRYNPHHLPKFEYILISWDTAFKATKDSARSACTVWGVSKNEYYLLYAWAEKVEFPELKRKGIDVWQAYLPVNLVAVEDKASGPSMVQELKEDTTMPLKAIKVDGDKMRRAFVVTPLFESGKIKLPQSAPWLDMYIEELCSFPAPTGYADLVDSTSQALTELIKIKKRMERFESNVIPLTGSIYGV